MSTASIIKRLDVVEDIFLRDISRLVDALLDSLLLQAAEKGFRHGIIPTVSPATHAGLKVVLMTEP